MDLSFAKRLVKAGESRFISDFWGISWEIPISGVSEPAEQRLGRGHVDKAEAGKTHGHPSAAFRSGEIRKVVIHP